MNCNELSLTSLIKTRHSHTTLNLKTTVIYFIIMCGAKMIRAFALSSVVRGYHEFKDAWNAPNNRA